MTALNGILPVDKPVGPTSHDIVAAAKPVAHINGLSSAFGIARRQLREGKRGEGRQHGGVEHESRRVAQEDVYDPLTGDQLEIYFSSKREGNEDAAVAAERDELPPILDYLESVVPEGEGYLVGDRLTLADISVASPFVNLLHLGIEEQLVELVADVVVVVDVFARAMQRVGGPAMHPLRDVPSEVHRIAPGIGRASIQQLDHAAEIAVHLDLARAVQLAEFHVRVHAKPHQRAPVRDVQRRNRLAGRVHDPIAVPKRELDGRIAECMQQCAQHAAFHGT